GKEFCARRSGMKPELERIEVECAVPCDDDLSIEHASSGQLRGERLEQLRKVAVQRFLIAALDQYFLPVAEDQRPEPIPFRLENPISPCRKFGDTFRKHRQNRRVHWKIHSVILYRVTYRSEQSLDSLCLSGSLRLCAEESLLEGSCERAPNRARSLCGAT